MSYLKHVIQWFPLEVEQKHASLSCGRSLISLNGNMGIKPPFDHSANTAVWIQLGLLGFSLSNTIKDAV